MKKVIGVLAVIVFIGFLVHETIGAGLPSILNWQSNIHGYIMQGFNIMPVMKVPAGV